MFHKLFKLVDSFIDESTVSPSGEAVSPLDQGRRALAQAKADIETAASERDALRARSLERKREAAEIEVVGASILEARRALKEARARLVEESTRFNRVDSYASRREQELLGLLADPSILNAPEGDLLEQEMTTDQ